MFTLATNIFIAQTYVESDEYVVLDEESRLSCGKTPTDSGRAGKSWHSWPARTLPNREFLQTIRCFELELRYWVGTLADPVPHHRYRTTLWWLWSRPDTTTRWLHGIVPSQARILLRRTRAIDTTDMCHCRGTWAPAVASPAC